LFLPCCLASAIDNKGRTWNGDFATSIGGNFKFGDGSYGIKATNSVGEVSATWGFRSNKVVFKNDFRLSSDYVISDRTGETVNYEEGETDPDNYSGSIEYSVQKQEAYKLLSNWEVSFMPSAMNSFFVFYKWDNQNNDPVKLVANSDLREYLSIPLEELKYSFSYQESINNTYDNRAGFRWDHNFNDPDKKLQSKFEGRFNLNDFSSEWYKGHYSDEQIIDNHFFETPDHYAIEAYLSSKYMDLSFCNMKGLQMFFTLDLIYKGNIDDKSTLVLQEASQWVHKTKSEYFEYSNLTVDPRIQAKYSLKKFSFDFMIVPQLYWYRLKDKKHSKGYDSSKITLPLDISVVYSINEHHFLKAGIARNLTRPSYLNLCWFRRQGAYINEFYDGNPYLKPEVSNRALAEYIFRQGRYTLVGTLSNTYQKNKIEMVFDEEEQDDGSKIRVYSWINGGWSSTTNLKLNNTWSGKMLSATLGGDINYFYGEARNGNVSRNFDYRLNGLLQCNWKTWIFLVRGHYQSKIIRTYNSMTQYVGLDFRVEKAFKRFSVYIEGKDVFDNAIQTVTYSEDQLKWRLEEANYNRQRFLLGLRYKF